MYIKFINLGLKANDFPVCSHDSYRAGPYFVLLYHPLVENTYLGLPVGKWRIDRINISFLFILGVFLVCFFFSLSISLIILSEANL